MFVRRTGELEKRVFKMQPEELGINNIRQQVYALKSSIYGLKQSFEWRNTTINKFLIKLNFRQSVSDPCVYVHNDN